MRSGESWPLRLSSLMQPLTFFGTTLCICVGAAIMCFPLVRLCVFRRSDHSSTNQLTASCWIVNPESRGTFVNNFDSSKIRISTLPPLVTTVSLLCLALTLLVTVWQAKQWHFLVHWTLNRQFSWWLQLRFDDCPPETSLNLVTLFAQWCILNRFTAIYSGITE